MVNITRLTSDFVLPCRGLGSNELVALPDNVFIDLASLRTL